MLEALKLFVWLLVGANALIAIVTAGRAARRSPAGGGPGRDALRGLGALAALALVECLAVRVLGGGWFGAIRVAYLTIGVAVPALGVWLLAQGRRHETGSNRLRRAIVAGVLIAPAPVCAYASFVEPRLLRVEQVHFAPRGAVQGATIRIGVLADLQTDHVGSHERDAVGRLMAARPDLILMPGDFFQGGSGAFERERAALLELLRTLRAPLDVFAVLGDVDPPARTRELLRDADIRLLVNEVATLDVRGARLALGGVGLDYASPGARAVPKDLHDTQADARILVAHRPDAIFVTTPGDRIDLIVAGHTHGGQFVIPGFGPPLTLSRVPREVGAGGLHKLGAQAIYVSRGVGVERGAAPPLRLFCPPEVTLIEFMIPGASP